MNVEVAGVGHCSRDVQDGVGKATRHVVAQQNGAGAGHGGTGIEIHGHADPIGGGTQCPATVGGDVIAGNIDRATVDGGEAGVGIRSGEREGAEDRVGDPTDSRDRRGNHGVVADDEVGVVGGPDRIGAGKGVGAAG